MLPLAHVLTLLEGNKGFEIYNDASHRSLGSISMQEEMNYPIHDLDFR